MVVKSEEGLYQCVVCGDTFDFYGRAKKHESLCGIQKLDSFMNMQIQDADINDLDIPEMDPVHGRQMKIGEKYIGACAKCGTTITSEHVYHEPRGIYECPKCQKLVNENRC